MQYISGARLLWGDRNPINYPKNYYASGVAPHGLVQRWSYTVPAGKKAQVHGTYTSIVIDTAATTAGLREARIIFSDGATSPMLIQAIVGADKNTIGQKDNMSIGVGTTVLAGYSIISYTQDISTGGTVSYSVGAVITEYDA